MFDRFLQLMLTIAVWLLLISLAPMWLRRFNYGPLEWVWRSLTYGHAVPLTREAPGLPAS